MVEDRLRPGMREDDRHPAQLEHLVERRVGAVAAVDDDAEPVHLRHPLPAERRQAVPARLAGGADRRAGWCGCGPARPCARRAGGRWRAATGPRRAASYSPSLMKAMRRPSRCSRSASSAVSARPIRSRFSPITRWIAAARTRAASRAWRIACRRQLALRGVDDEEAAIEPALAPSAADRPGCRPTRSGGARAKSQRAVVEAGGDVEMGVEHEHPLVREPVLGADVGLLRRGGDGEKERKAGKVRMRMIGLAPAVPPLEPPPRRAVRAARIAELAEVAAQRLGASGRAPARPAPP